MRDFIRLQLKLKWGFNRNNSKASAIMTAVAAFLAVVLALALVWALSFVLKASIAVTARQLSVLYLAVMLGGLTIASTGMQLKRLYRPADLLITARFPLSPFKLFSAQLILNYIDLCIYTAILFVPVMLVFGVAMGCLSWTFLLGMVLSAVLLPTLPFALSIFIAIPAVYLSSLLEKHGILRLIVFVVVLVGAFLLYYYLLTVLAQFFIHRNWEVGTLDIWRNLLAALDREYDPAVYFAGILFFERFWYNFAVIVGGAFALITGGVLLARVVCAGLYRKALDGGNGLRGHGSELDGYASGRAIFRYGFKEFLRTKTYSYFYLGVAISTPVMVFFCDRLVSMVGVAQIGEGINFGASMLVVSVFMAMICSFTGTIISVEGKNFYITKLVPVPYRKQLLVKGLLNIGVSAAALAISAVVMGWLQFLTLAEIGVLVGIEFVLSVGLVFNGINLNLANPNLKPKANGEAEEINITYMLLIGLAVAALIGAGCIIFSKLPDGRMTAYLAAAAVAFVYAAINFLVFWFTSDCKYRKIEA